jgi:hypothetical protein
MLTHRSFNLRGHGIDRPVDLIVLIVDHFEPPSRHGLDSAVESVLSWCAAYRKIADRHRDTDARPPQHTWFYRTEYANPGCVQALSDEAFSGYGEVEFHLHHGHDTHESFAEKLSAGLKLCNDYGAMLTAEARPRGRFAYIAGNWSLDNGSRDARFSGCNTELIALRDAGCYADFTFPALGSPAQPRKSNAIYYATDDPRPKSYDTGVDMAVGRPASGDLLMFQGPLAVNWRRGLFDGAAIETYAPPDPKRLETWLKAHVHVKGRPEWVFVKLHTHGIQSRQTFLSPALDAMFDEMDLRWNRPPFRLHYVTAREAYNIAKAAEAGHQGNPDRFRDYEVPQPANRLIRCDRPWTLRSCSEDRVEIDLRGNREMATVEFARIPLRSVRGKISRLRVDLQEGTVKELKAEAEGEVDTEYRKEATREDQNWNGLSV